MDKFDWWYNCKVERVIDGDTFYAEVDLGLHASLKCMFRLNNVDTPETHRPKSENERHHGKLATKFTTEWFTASDNNVIVKTHKTGKFGRYLADVFNSDGECLNKLLVENNLIKLEDYSNYEIHGKESFV